MIGLYDKLITCRCGRHSMRRPFIFEPVEIRRIRDTLTENCEVCRALARYHAHGHRDASGRFAVSTNPQSEPIHV